MITFAILYKSMNLFHHWKKKSDSEGAGAAKRIAVICQVLFTSDTDVLKVRLLKKYFYRLNRAQ